MGTRIPTPKHNSETPNFSLQWMYALGMKVNGERIPKSLRRIIGRELRNDKKLKRSFVIQNKMRRMNISIYGKPDCSRCAMVRRLLPDASYAEHGVLFDRYGMEAADIVQASGGELPIIIVEGEAGRLVLGPSKATIIGNSECEGGACKIGDRHA